MEKLINKTAKSANIEPYFRCKNHNNISKIKTSNRTEASNPVLPALAL